MRFLSALPPVWRILQCIRQYKDTRNIFPHLVNCGKYSLTIMSVLTLSLYRISETHGKVALFIALSVINSIYCCKLSLVLSYFLRVVSKYPVDPWTN